MPLAFEQQPRESAKAFAAFKTYLDMGPQRSLVAVAAKLDRHASQMERWSVKFDWPARVQAHAAHFAEIERKAIEARAVERAVDWEKTHEPVKREAYREAQETIAMVRKARAEWLEKGRVPGWEGMARMLDLAFKLMQFATGLPSEVKEVKETHTTKLRVEWEVALKKVYGHAPAAVVDVEPLKKEVAGGNAVVEPSLTCSSNQTQPPASRADANSEENHAQPN